MLPSVAQGRRASFVPEPNLAFGHGELAPDPKAGIFSFGPPAPTGSEPTPASIRLGVIGSKKTVESLQLWILRCAHPIASLQPGTFSKVEFPGFQREQGFRCEAQIDRNLIEVLDGKALERLPKLGPSERLAEGVNLIVGGLRVLSHREPPPSVTVIALPQEIIDSCVIGMDRFGRRPRTALNSRTRGPARRQLKLENFLPEGAGESASTESAKHYSNLRRAVKFEAWKLGMETQIVWESTLAGTRPIQDPSTVAWNFFTGLYYKAQGHPWHLADAQVGTCFVGVSFFRDFATSGDSLDASTAQIFSHTGDGMVLRGDRAAYRDPEDKRPRLSRQSAAKVAQESIAVYQSQMGVPPRRLVIHKTSRFSPDEIEGFRSAASGIRTLDLVTIEDSRFVVYRQGNYPPLRGTVIPMDGYGTLVYTKAYSPYLGTYPGPGVPRPVAILEHHGDSTTHSVVEDLLAMTKLNWNSADFSCSLPITVQFAKRIGEVFSQGPTDPEVRSRFSFFI